MAAGQQHIGGADECGGDQREDDEFGLPDGRLTQHLALEDHLTDDNDAEQDQQGGDHPADPRQHFYDGDDMLPGVIVSAPAVPCGSATCRSALYPTSEERGEGTEGDIKCRSGWATLP